MTVCACVGSYLVCKVPADIIECSNETVRVPIQHRFIPNIHLVTQKKALTSIQIPNRAHLSCISHSDGIKGTSPLQTKRTATTDLVASN